MRITSQQVRHLYYQSVTNQKKKIEKGRVCVWEREKERERERERERRNIRQYRTRTVFFRHQERHTLQ